MQGIAKRRGGTRKRVQTAHSILVVYLSCSMLWSGCRFPNSHRSIEDDEVYACHAQRCMTEIVGQATDPDTTTPTSDSPAETPEPRTLNSELPEDDDSKYWDMSLQEAIHYGLTNSRVLNDLGGTILRNPDVVPSNMTPAIVQTDPRFGIEGALSAFDARFNFSNKIENNDVAFNNLFLSGGNTGRSFVQSLNTSTTELIKQTVTGGLVAVRNVTIYDANSAPSNLFPSSWTTYYEAEARQALLQGGGVDFNRIAGPNGLPGYYNGVKIARLRADISQAEFEISLRDYLSNIENAYWDLHFAYRDLASKVDLRDQALEIYELYKTRIEQGLGMVQPFKLAQIKEQYYRFQEDVQNALTGRRVDGTRTNNGSNPGTFRGGSGVYLAERRLRLIMGIPASDSRLIRPTDEASQVETIMNWEMVKTEALQRRPELHRQKFQLQRAELELVASRNYLKPRLDLVGKYRFRGFGNDLIGYGVNGNSQDTTVRFDNAYTNLMTGQYQESQVGVEFSMPIGYRQGNAAVAQAEYRVARERAVLMETERQIVHDVGNAIADMTRSHAVAKTAWSRRSSAFAYLDGMLNKIKVQVTDADLEQCLEAQRRFAESDSQYFLALSEHQIALKNVNYEKGSLLDYCNILPVDGVTPPAPEAPPLIWNASTNDDTPVELGSLSTPGELNAAGQTAITSTTDADKSASTAEPSSNAGSR